MANQPSFRKKLLIRLGAALAIILGLLTFIMVLNSDLNKRLSRLNDYKAELQSREAAIGLLTQLKSDAERAEPFFSVLKNSLPSRDDLVLFPRELERFAKQYEVDFGFSFGEEAVGSASSPSAVKFTIVLEGQYDNLLAFLKAVEQSRYYIRLSSIDISRKEEGKFGLISSGEVYIRSSETNDKN